MMLARVLLGIALGGFWSLSTATAMRLVPFAFFPQALSIIFSGVSIANVVVAPLGTFLGDLIGWRGVFLVGGALGLLGFLGQYFTLPRMAPTGGTSLNTLVSLLGRRVVQFGLLGLFLTFGGYIAFFTYLRPFLEGVTHLTVTTITGALFAMGLASFAGSTVAGRVVGWNRRAVHILTPLLMGVLILGFFLFGHLSAVTAVLLALFGFLFSFLPVAWSNWIAHAVPDEVESAGGLQVAAIQGGMTLGAALGGMTLDHAGIPGLLTGSGLALLLGALVILFGLKERTHTAASG